MSQRAELSGLEQIDRYDDRTRGTVRRRGIGAALTAAAGVRPPLTVAGLVFLSAWSEEIARVYGRIGFERVATACIASAPAPEPHRGAQHDREP